MRSLGDGACLFRALSDQLHGTPNYHLALRQEVCNFLLAHAGEFTAFIDDSSHSSPEAAFAAHVAEMRMPATYGTQVEIVVRTPENSSPTRLRDWAERVLKPAVLG